MSDIASLITDNLDIWTGAIEHKSAAGRGRSKKGKISLYGIEKLRALILDLAVRGKLVPQNPNDEPASELLKRIKAEKAKLIAEKKIKKGKPLPPIGEGEKPFDLPLGWEWCRISELGHDLGQKKPDQNFTYIDVGAINKELGIVEEPTELTANKAPSRARKLVKKGTVIYSTVRPYLLNIAVIDCVFDPAPIASTAFAIIHPFQGIDASYVYRYLRSPTFISYVERCQSGIAYPAINDKRFFAGVFPLPPLAEQKRIVTRVDELMALCDELETQGKQAIAAHQLLVKTLLATLTDSKDAKELADNWSRIASSFDTLFTSEASIDQLKQTILQLAVMGKLAPQNPDDEPASELLKRIKAEKAKLIVEKKIKKSKPLPPVADNDGPFDLPSKWEWARFGEYAYEVSTGPFGSMLHKSDYIEGGIPVVNPSHMVNDRIVENRSVAISHKLAKKFTSYQLLSGDLIIARRGEVGRVAIVTNHEHGWICGTGSFRARFSISIFRPYLLLIFRSNYARIFLRGEAVGMTMANLNHSILKKLPLGIPPLAEQKRIVAKVDELMALCDSLKSRITDAGKLQKQLADTITKQATA